MSNEGNSRSGKSGDWCVSPYSAIAAAATLILFFAPLGPAHACGWWGDGEMNRDEDPAIASVTSETGRQLSDREASKLPGRMGYGLAVPDPGHAIPYLRATYGRRINRIGELESLGYKTVIDLGTPSETARFHRAETEALGMRYVNIPIEGSLPTREQTERFSRLIVDSGRYPLLVYAPTAELLGAMWASYRIGYLGAPRAFAIEEGRSMGMTQEQGAALFEMFR